MRTFLALALVAAALAGCGPAQEEQRTPFQASAPPAGYIESRMKLREKGAQPPARGAATAVAPGKKGP